MKTITIILISLISLNNGLKAQVKAFEKGKVSIDLGIGFGYYGTKISEAKNETVYSFGPGGLTSKIERTSEDTTDAAASTVIPLTIEYGITNWLGIGVRGAYSNYFEGKDSATNTRPTVKGIDADLLISLHFIKTKRFDMPLTFIGGYSNFSYSRNDSLETKAKDNGLSYGLALVPRIYFNNYVGLYFNVAYKGYYYPSLLYSDKTDSNLNDNNNQDILVKYKGNGINIGVGLIVKF